MLEQGQVLDVGDASARVQVTPDASCATCGNAHACAGTQGRPFVVDAANPCDAKAGDSVVVDMAPVSPMAAVLLVFVGPLVMMLVGLAIGQGMVGADWGGAVGAAIGLLVAFGVMRVAHKRIEANAKYRPTIVRVVAAGMNHEEREEGGRGRG